MSGGWSGSFDDRDAVVHADLAAEQAAIAAVEASGRGRPVDKIEAELDREMRAKRLFLPQEEINLLANQISDPNWALKHPWTARRLFAEMRRAVDAQESAFQQEWDRTLGRLQQALESMRRLRRSAISSRRTVDGVDVEIRIDPWSRRRARKLQGIAAPAVVSVVPYDPSGRPLAPPAA